MKILLAYWLLGMYSCTESIFKCNHMVGTLVCVGGRPSGDLLFPSLTGVIYTIALNNYLHSTESLVYCHPCSLMVSMVLAT